MVACGGGAFSSANDDGESGSASGGKSTTSAGESTSGGKSSGGTGSEAGSGATGGTSSMGGMSSGGNTTSGGVSSSGHGGMQGGDGGSVVGFQCQSPADCPTSNSCHEPTCDNGACDEVHVPDGPFHLQVAGDCKRMDCIDGEEKVVADTNDSNDSNECTIDSCSQNGIPTHKARFGEVCANGGGTCNGEGQCVLCNRNLCPAATTCFAAICGNGSCQLAPRPAGDLCPLISPNDPNDQYGQCDGTGVCVDCVTSGACGECCVCLNQTCIDA